MQHLRYSGVGHMRFLWIGPHCSLDLWKSKGRRGREGSEVTKISAPGSSGGTAGTSLGPGLSKKGQHEGSPGFHHNENPLVLTRLLIFVPAKE